MAKIERAHQKVFCNSVAATDNVAQFGSLKAAAIQFSKDPSIIQALAAFEEGWKSAVVTNNAPALQDMNALFYLLSRQNAYSLQAGIPEWHTDTPYFLDDYCRSGNAVYCSLANDNLGFAVTDTSKWVKVFEPNTSGGTLGSVPLGSVIAIGNTQAWALPTADQVKDGFALCNGNTFAALGVGNYNAAFTGNRPQISDSRFLMGSTAVGATGGANSITLSVTDLPSHSHSLPSHSHTIDHDHGSVATSSAGDHAHTYSLPNAAGAGLFGTTSTQTSPQNFNTGNAGAHTHSVDLPLFTGSSGAWSGTSGAVGSGAAIENRPAYFSVVYVMRVK